jgi:hypothetical protein
VRHPEALDVHALGTAWAGLPRVAEALPGEGVSARNVAAVVSHEHGALTHQAAAIAEGRTIGEHQGVVRSMASRLSSRPPDPSTAIAEGQGAAGLGAVSAVFDPEAKSVGRWVRHGWHVALAYVVGFFVMLLVLGWHPDAH